jgi:hypothetical protein
MNSIIENLRDKKDIIKIHDWMRIDKTITDFSTRKLSLKDNTAIGDAFNIDTKSMFANMIVSEVNGDLIRYILKSMFDTKNFDYLDLRPDGSLMNGRIHLENLVQMIINSGYKNVVTSGKIASELGDSQSFSPVDFKQTIRSTSNLYTPGSLSDIKIWVDPYMRWNDDRLCLFNLVDINFNNIDLSDSINPGDLQPTVKIEYTFGFSVRDTKLIFVIENENSESYKHYKSLQRDIKIDNIINGD